MGSDADEHTGRAARPDDEVLPERSSEPSGSEVVFSASSRRDGSRSLVTIRGELDLTVIEPLKARLREAVAEGVQTVELDASEVTFIDSVALALLLAFQVNAPKEGMSLRVVAASDQFAHVVKLAGLDAALLPPAEDEDADADSSGT